jgi:outer membrane protein OmpA-like peptidoglycan-associated protein
MKKILVFLFLFCASITSNAQAFKEDYAKSLSTQFKFVEAYPVWADLSETFVKKQKGDWSYLRMATEAAYNSEQYKNALHWNSILTRSNQALLADWTLHFELLRMNNMHSLLVASVDSALTLIPAEAAILEWKKQASTIVSYLQDTSEFEVKDFRNVSKGEEFAAVPFEKGLVFVTSEFNTGFLARKDTWTGQNYYELTFIKDANSPYDSHSAIDKLKNNDVWNEIEHTYSHDGPISFNKDFSKALLTRNFEELDTIARVKYSRLKLILFKKEEGKWIEDVTFNFNDKHFSTGHGVFDVNGNIIFASDRPGGLGGSDLYTVSYTDGKWSVPNNLGKYVNTSSDELFPFVDSNGTMYFSSKGWVGLGGLDVFSANTAGTPNHIGIPINTSSDDFAFYLDAEAGTGYLSSNRNSHKDQIFKISTPVYDIELEIILTACDKKPIENATIEIKNKLSNTTSSQKTDKEGKVLLKPRLKDEFEVSYSGNELYASSKNLPFKATSEGKFKINLESNYLKSNQTITLLDENGKPLVGSLIQIKSKDNTVKKANTNEDGVYSWSRTSTESVLTEINCNTVSYEDHMIKLDGSDCNATQNYRVTMQKMSDEKFVKLDLVLYDFDKYFLRTASEKELDKLVQYMKERPELVVELSSHTDCRGTNNYNEVLSQNRAQSCVNYIIKKGIPKDRIIAKGYGEKQLTNKCSDGVNCTEDEHQANRRTQLKFVIK